MGYRGNKQSIVAVIGAFYCAFVSHKLYFNQLITTKLSQITAAQAETHTDRQGQVNRKTVLKLPTLVVQLERRSVRNGTLVLPNKKSTHPRILPITEATTTKTTATKTLIQTIAKKLP